MPDNLVGFIDHTLLKPEATARDIENLCREAAKYGFAAVCINPCYVRTACKLLRGSRVKVCTVIGFPLGASTTDVKSFEAAEAIRNGATEIDMVINIGALKEGRYTYVTADVSAVIDAAQGRTVKVILETSLLTTPEKIAGCCIAQQAGAHFVKTSTGFSLGGATISDVRLMRKHIGSNMGVKASGGIRTRSAAEEMIAAGATRIGTSSGIIIVNQNC